MRSYDQFCALAKALDVVGDRWTLLIVRELLIRGRCRYTDLREGLPGIATNLLADRLRELEQSGIVERELAPPPIATTVFRLTPRGLELRPVIQQLGRWGGPLLAHKSRREAFRSHWLAVPLEHSLTDSRPGRGPVSIEIRTGEQPLWLETTGDGTVRATAAPSRQASVVVSGQPLPVLDFLMGKIRAAEARAAGVRVEGDPKVLRRVRSAQGRP